MSDLPLLVSVVELGGYPNFAPLFARKGYRHEVVQSGRRAISYLKQQTPAVIVAEFNFQFAFRDRTSGLESILAVAQAKPEVKVIVFYDPEFTEQLDAVHQRFPFFQRLPLPVTEADLEPLL